LLSCLSRYRTTTSNVVWVLRLVNHHDVLNGVIKSKSHKSSFFQQDWIA
jgi:hypothetical protein